MANLLATRTRCLVGYPLVVVGAMACLGLADDKNKAGKGREEVLAIRRFELMQEKMASAKVRSDEAGFPERFAARPIFRYSDPARGFAPPAIDRYTPSKTERSDGAIFLFTFGTNPEVVLLIESDGKRWSYAVGRMTGAQVVVLTLDNAVVWEGGPLEMSRDSAFTGGITPLDIPRIAADGSEIPE
jgi:hypothetical protein